MKRSRTSGVTGETLTVSNRFNSASYGYGLEQIKFADGTLWSLSDILNATRVTGTAAAETLSGSDYQDNIFGLAGNDTLNGNAGDDVLVGGQGADTMNGGAGTDTVSYATSSAAATVNLTTNVNTGGDAQGDSLSAIENIRGSANADSLTGDSASNHLWGGDGNDTLAGGAGDDIIETGLGADQVNGGDGTLDLVDYLASAAAVTVNLSTNANSGGDAQGDTLTNVESVRGSQWSDSLTGDALANELYGAAGNDILNGKDGDDQLFGGEGNDTFEFSSLTFGNDVIHDFEDGHDRISFGLTGLTLSDFTVTQIDDDTVLTLTTQPAHKIVMLNVLQSSIDASDVV